MSNQTAFWDATHASEESFDDYDFETSAFIAEWLRTHVPPSTVEEEWV